MLNKDNNVPIANSELKQINLVSGFFKLTLQTSHSFRHDQLSKIAH